MTNDTQEPFVAFGPNQAREAAKPEPLPPRLHPIRQIVVQVQRLFVRRADDLRKLWARAS